MPAAFKTSPTALAVHWSDSDRTVDSLYHSCPPCRCRSLRLSTDYVKSEETRTWSYAVVKGVLRRPDNCIQCGLPDNCTARGNNRFPDLGNCA